VVPVLQLVLTQFERLAIHKSDALNFWNVMKDLCIPAAPVGADDGGRAGLGGVGQRGGGGSKGAAPRRLPKRKQRKGEGEVGKRFEGRGGGEADATEKHERHLRGLPASSSKHRKQSK